MSFEEKEKFWKMLFEKISKSVFSNYRFTVVFGLNEVIGERGKDKADEYTLIVEEDQYEIFLSNYLKWCEGLERFEECQEIIKVLTALKSKEPNNKVT